MKPAWAIAPGALAAAIALALAAMVGDDTAARAQLSARWTARAAFLAFLPLYLAPALGQFHALGAKGLAAPYRRYWGLGFALAMFVHLAALLVNVQVGNRVLTPFDLGGVVVYGLLAAMVASSSEPARRRMGPWWDRLHKVGIHAIFVVFAQSYFFRLFDPDKRTAGALFGTIALVAFALRITAWHKRRA